MDFNKAQRYAIHGSEIYKHWNFRKHVRITSYIFKSHLYTLGNKVLTYCFFLILDDIIKNDVTFQFPCDNVTIQMEPCDKELAMQLFKDGKVPEVDYLASNFNIYQLVFKLIRKSKTTSFLISTSRYFTDQIIKLTNKGKSW